MKTLGLEMQHTHETFLAPLIDPSTGEEVPFFYEPWVQAPKDSNARLSVPKYGTWEMTDLLVKQYNPIFHAATNIPSFIRAFSAICNLKHLRISCRGQESSQRYRRSTVDYFLISIRVAVERCKLPALDTLTLAPIHPGAVLYLHPIMGIGARPNSVKVWQQIRRLSIEMDGYPLESRAPGDHHKILHSYLHVFSSSLRRLKFRWLGFKGPCPISLGAESSLQTPSPPLACPKRCHLALRPLKFKHLRHMEVEHLSCDASQVSGFITTHRRTIREFNFEDCHIRNGTWDDALAPLDRLSGSNRWKEKVEEVMDVPIVLSPVEDETIPKIADSHLELLQPKAYRPPYKRWHTAGEKAKDLLRSTPEQAWKCFRNSMLGWR